VSAKGLTAFAEGWEAHRHRHCIWIVSPPGYPHQLVFDELASALVEASSELGGSAPLVRRRIEFDGRVPIVLGANLLAKGGLPPPPAGSIIYNLEQYTPGSLWHGDRYGALLSRFPTLDFSRRNREALQAAGLGHTGLLEVGYSPVLRRIPQAEKDIDVLFYGSINPRRRAVLRELADRGFQVVHAFGVYGAERDALIGRAKLVLNHHYYDANIFEIVRVSYLLANGVCVVAEAERDDPDVEALLGGLEIASYECLADRCTALLEDERRREDLGRAGLEIIEKRRQSELLRRCIAEAVG